MNQIFEFILHYGITAMFFVIFLEYACFPVSSEIVLPFSGAFASACGMPFLLILTISVAAGTLGTSVCYLIGYFGGEKILEKLGRKYPKFQNSMDASYVKFEKYGPYIICFGRMIPLIRTYIAFVAGSVRQNYAAFCIYSILGITVWNCVLIGIGYFLKENWAHAISYYDRYKNIMIPVLLLVLLFFVYKKLSNKKKNK